METVFLAKDGRPIDVEIHATALFDQERGGLVHSRAFVRDVTERHRLEQELQQYTTELEQAVSERTQQLVASQARYKALFDLGRGLGVHGGRDGDGSSRSINGKSRRWAMPKRRWSAAPVRVVVPRLSRRVCADGWPTIGTGQRQVPTQEIMVHNAEGHESLSKWI